MSWLNPWSWNPIAVDRWERRIAGFFRWLLIILALGSGVGFLAWFAVGATKDIGLSRDGVVATATVEEAGPDKKHTQYPPYTDPAPALLSFVVNGQTEAYWSTDLDGLKVGDRVPLLVNRHDHADFEPTTTYHHRWGGYLIQILASAAFTTIGVMFTRTDAADFRSWSTAHYRGLTSSRPSPPTNRPTARRKDRRRPRKSQRRHK